VRSGFVTRSCLLLAAFVPFDDASADERTVRSLKAASAPNPCMKPEPAPGPQGVAGGDIFGFISPTDIGEPCSFAYAAEVTGRAGKRDGRYVTATKKSQFTYTFSDQLSFAASPFVSAFSWNDVSINRGILLTSGVGVDHTSLDTVDFDGLSAEASWRVLQRSPNQPLAITLSTEPRWFRRDAITGHRVAGRQIEMKLFADIALSERWFAAVNAIYAVGTQRLAIPGAELQKGSAYGVTSALTWQAYSDEAGGIQGVFVGAEARYIAGFSGLTLNFRVGEAVFAGPTLAIAFKGGSMLNLAWSPQVWGRELPSTSAGMLDLDSFEKHQFRIKFAAPL
jgi:hypothetical protein